MAEAAEYGSGFISATWNTLCGIPHALLKLWRYFFGASADLGDDFTDEQDEADYENLERSKHDKRLEQFKKEADKLAEEASRDDSAIATNATWREVELNVAVVGAPGAGKSSLVNSLRNLRAGDERAAPVGATSTSDAVEKYVHPENEHFAFWELPGTEPLCRIEALNPLYDLFIIVGRSRFTEADAKFVLQAHSGHKDVDSLIGRMFVYVWTNIDVDVRNSKEDHGQSQEEAMRTIRQTIESNLAVLMPKEGQESSGQASSTADEEKNGDWNSGGWSREASAGGQAEVEASPKHAVFLVNARKGGQYEFEKMREYLLENLVEEKRRLRDARARKWRQHIHLLGDAQQDATDDGKGIGTKV